MSESIDGENKKNNINNTDNKTDFMNISGNILTNINYKVTFLLFIMGMLLFSDVFIENVLTKFKDTVDGECTTTKGTIIQLLLLIISYIVLDLLVKYKFL
jgi:hypothetical protein